MPFHEEGMYDATIVEAAVTKAKSGNYQVELELKLNYLKTPEGTATPKPSRFNPRIYLTMTEKTMGTPAEPGWVTQTLAYLGFGGDFDNVHQEVGNGGVVGWTGQVHCEHKPDLNNNLKDNWSIVNNTPRAKADPIDKKTTRHLNAMFGKGFKAATKAPPAKVPDTPPATLPLNDDIPF